MAGVLKIIHRIDVLKNVFLYALYMYIQHIIYVLYKRVEFGYD